MATKRNPQYIREWRRARRKKLTELMGGKCVECGSTSELQFDHIDPTSREFVIATSLNNSWERLLAEISKCQLLCLDCHCIKSYKERGRSKSAHGTYAYYINKRCRCVDCRRANNLYVKSRRKAVH
jgi:5-methylcytosine-specific restriction endonuclease McrA